MIRVLVVCLLLALPAWAEEAASLSRPAEVGGAPGWPLDLVQRADPVRAAPSSRDESDDAGDALGLDEAVTMALDHNRLVQNSTLDVAKSGNQLASAKTQRLPQLQLSVTPAYLAAPIDVKFDQGTLGTFPSTGPIPAQDTTIRTNPGFLASVTASVTQPIAQLYKIGLTIDQLGVARDMSRQDLRTQRQSIMNNVKQAYYAILQSQSALEALQEQVASNRELERVVTEQVAQETALPSDLMQVKAALAQAEYNVASTQHTLASQKEQLNHLLGRDPATPFTVSPVPLVTPMETDLPVAREVALRQRPELQKATLQISYADYDVRIKRAQFIPDLSLVFKYVSPVTSDVLPKNIAYVGVQFDWDIWDWGKKRQDMTQSQRALEQARNSVAETASQVTLDVNSSFRKLQDSQAFVTVARLNRDAAREKLRVAINQYRQQSALLKDVLAAQASLGQAEDQSRQSVLSLWQARANFEKAVGSDR